MRRPPSLDRLARDTARNRRIVDHYIEHQRNYGQTIVFACNIPHADVLANEFCARGIAARPVHSDLPAAMNSNNVALLKEGKLQVLVNVAMLTHGVDIPSVRTVFLARPTFSDILFSQMVGRAARRHAPSKKTTFFIVEFADQLDRYGDQLVTPKGHFEGTGILQPNGAEPIARPETSRRGRQGHGFDPMGQPRLIPDDPRQPEAMRGLWFREGQTFGFEFELTSSDFHQNLSNADWSAPAERLRQALESALPGGRVARRVISDFSTPASHEHWNVTRDNSCGWEVTTRVLQNETGMHELMAGADALRTEAERLGLHVNWRTGMHLHLGWLGKRTDALERAIRLVRLFEPALATLVSPSRVVGYEGSSYDTSRPNEYCRPVSAVFPERALNTIRRASQLAALCSDHDDRYVTFNVRPLNEINTVEARLHNGTLEPGKFLLWLSLWQQILWAADYAVSIAPVPDAEIVRPTGDIVDLARRYLPGGSIPHFLRRLDTRRREIAAIYRRDLSLTTITPAEHTWTRP